VTTHVPHQTVLADRGVRDAGCPRHPGVSGRGATRRGPSRAAGADPLGAQRPLVQTEVPGGEPILLIGHKPEGLEFPDERGSGGPKAGAAVEKGYPAEAKPAPAGAAAEKTLGAGAEVRIVNAEEKRRFRLPQGDPLAAAQPGPPAALLSSTAFPQPLNPVDDLPPATVITFVGRSPQGKLMVRGTTSDNGTVRRVLVNGHEAKATAPNFAEWEIILDQTRPGELKLTARAEDAAGNAERFPHELSVTVPR
jgi:hypothetical protein